MQKTLGMIIGVLILMWLVGCSDQTMKPLSVVEKERLHELPPIIEKMKKELQTYNTELARIEGLKGEYLLSSIELINVKASKSSRFDDGRSRLCLRGVVRNKGDEIIEKLTLKVSFERSNANSESVFNSWDIDVIDANDEILTRLKETDPQTYSAVKVLGKDKYPLKPRDEVSINICKPEPMPDLQDNKKISVSKLDLNIRPQLLKVDKYKLMTIEAELRLLQLRSH